ncbi:MAG: tetratricopeptide repeat protein [Pirellulaceae bacterium]|jgi:tetratricopeptide (TPR) repeat protein|nr:tetratricopeptide repeat protein [Pirellulaceae bacterium]MDP6553585.1 tetratricopeptide repeat protein [Pirellulaceae bacterium]
MKRLVLALTLCLFLSVSTALPAQQFDQVKPLTGSVTSGVITGETTTHVEIEVRGTKREIPVNEIQRVTFGEDPTDLKRGRDNILTGNYEAGLDDLRKVDPASLSRGIIKQDYAFYRALAIGRLALSQGGDKTAANTAMMNFVRAAPTSFHFLEAAELLGDLAVSQAEYADAARYYAAITAKSPWSDYKMRGGVLEGRALIAQKKFAEAQTKFDGVIGTNDDSPGATKQKRVAEVGKAVCMAEQGQHEPAIAILNKIIAENDPKSMDLFGRAYNALGRSHLKAKRDKDALLAYLHVDLLFYGNPDVHAEALYHLSKLWNGANRAERAVAARNLLTTRYAGSPWAKLK